METTENLPAIRQSVNGKFGNAVDFDHNGDYIYIDNFAGITTSTFVSVSGWMNLDTVGTSAADDAACLPACE